ncbi:MAG: tRNA (adenosine(37)-N6)-threonylcarbamoyltransferase complex ATPase subunit type 1 TsaE, partial [Ignavibacteriaceae bacterium]
HEGKFKVFHFDFYRIKKVEELYDIGFKDYLNENGAVVFIEWGNMFPEILPKKRLEIEIKILDDFRREFRATNYE